MKDCWYRRLYFFIALLALPLFWLISIGIVALSRLSVQPAKPRLVWGITPIINNKYWSKAMNDAGYSSQTLMTGFYDRINDKNDFDEYVFDRFGRWLPSPIKLVLAFWASLFRFDVFFICYDGWLLGSTPYWRLEAWLLKIARKKTVVLPYGGDSYVYRNIQSSALIHALLLSYPDAGRSQNKREVKVQHWTQAADAVISGFTAPDGFGRWSTLLPNHLHIDTMQWQTSIRQQTADGKTGTVFITHCPNHTGFKGTEFVLDAVEKLKTEGVKVELRLLQNLKNNEVKRILLTETDILVEQLIFTGYALNGLEGMASGLPVLANLEDDGYTLMQRRWSFLDECPILSASPENLVDQLRLLVTRPDLRAELGRASRQYVDKYHSLEAAAELFGSAIEYVYGRLDGKDFMNMYHPLLGKYRNQPRITHPLKNNRTLN